VSHRTRLVEEESRWVARRTRPVADEPRWVGDGTRLVADRMQSVGHRKEPVVDEPRPVGHEAGLVADEPSPVRYPSRFPGSPRLPIFAGLRYTACMTRSLARPAVLVFVLVATLAAACSKPAAPTLAPAKVTVTRVDLTGITLDVVVDATNPNSADLSASGVSSHLVVDKTHDVGTVTVPKTIALPAGKTTRLEVPVSLSWADIGLLAQLAGRSAAVPYSIDGTLEMGGDLVHVGVPFHMDGTITHEQIVGAAMNSLPLPR
jgi:hypothetical protein